MTAGGGAGRAFVSCYPYIRYEDRGHPPKPTAIISVMGPKSCSPKNCSPVLRQKQARLNTMDGGGLRFGSTPPIWNVTMDITNLRSSHCRRMTVWRRCAGKAFVFFLSIMKAGVSLTPSYGHAGNTIQKNQVPEVRTSS